MAGPKGARPEEGSEPLVEVVLGAPAAGGGFIAHESDGRVLFVRHGLPGERVLVTINERHARFARADVIEVLDPSPDRVEPRCPLARPDLCGGCDWSHVALDAQRRFKEEKVNAALAHIGIERNVSVERADPIGLGTRTRLRFEADATGRLCLHRYRSDQLVPIPSCPLGVAPIDAMLASDRRWPSGATVELRSLSAETSASALIGANRRSETAHGAAPDREAVVVGGVTLEVSPTSFFQVHKRAPELLVGAVLDGLQVGDAARVLDLYCGVGLFSLPAAQVVGPRGSVVGVESARSACDDFERNATQFPWAKVVCDQVTPRSVASAGVGCEVVIVDPPRRGLDKGVINAIGALDRVRRVASVSCDGATFVRDLALLRAHGFAIDSICAFDLFEMTEHVEFVAILIR